LDPHLILVFLCLHQFLQYYFLKGKSMHTLQANIVVLTFMLANFRSVIVDTDTGAWSLQRMAAFGKLSQVPPNMYIVTNTRKRMMIREAEDSNCNVCFIYKAKKVYVKTKKDKMGQWDGKTYERDGFNESRALLVPIT